MADPGAAPPCVGALPDAAGELQPAKIRAAPTTAHNRTIRLFIRRLHFNDSAAESAHAIPP
jgi:hypothetical protein